MPMFARSNGVPVKIFMTADQEGPPDHYGTHHRLGESGIDVRGHQGQDRYDQRLRHRGRLAIRELQLAGVGWDDVKRWFPSRGCPRVGLGNADVRHDLPDAGSDHGQQGHRAARCWARQPQRQRHAGSDRKLLFRQRHLARQGPEIASPSVASI
jgi:hypothetical protein